MARRSLVGGVAAAGVALGLGLGLGIAAPAGPGPDGRYSPEQRNYSIGYDLGKQTRASMSEDGLEIQPDALIRGFSDALTGADPQVDEIDMGQALRQIEREVLTRLADRRMREDPAFRALAVSNLRQSEAWHEAFGETEGVATLDSGVQYRVLDEGAGEPPGENDVVVVTYKAKLIDGTDAFADENVERRVGGLLPGGREAVLRMRPGARWVIAIPPEQALGVAGRAPNIGPNETLVVDIRLVAVK